ncbi:MAG TPA: marine proteobacterial sortase target protein, partial [Pseudomonadales bacterium]
ETAFATPGEEPGTLRQIVFITDGAVANEEALLALIHERLQDRRLFTIGIGSAPNSYFMTEAAHFGRGSFTYIGSEQEIAATMDALFRQLERPAMTDIALSLPVAADLLPSPLPDLYSGQPLIAVMKLDALPGRAEASGRLGDSAWRHALTLHSAEERTGLGVYWAREKIRHWMRRKAAGMEPQQVRAEVVKLGLAHHLVSAYTSLVAVDVTPVRPDDAATSSHALDGNLPAGWRPPGQPGVTIEASLQLAQGATASQLYLLIGFLLLALAAVLRYRPQLGLRCRP